MTDCAQATWSFPPVKRRQVEANFQGVMSPPRVARRCYAKSTVSGNCRGVILNQTELFQSHLSFAWKIKTTVMKFQSGCSILPGAIRRCLAGREYG